MIIHLWAGATTHVAFLHYVVAPIPYLNHSNLFYASDVLCAGYALLRLIASLISFKDALHGNSGSNHRLAVPECMRPCLGQ